jgi:hypothetical protein
MASVSPLRWQTSARAAWRHSGPFIARAGQKNVLPRDALAALREGRVVRIIYCLAILLVGAGCASQEQIAALKPRLTGGRSPPVIPFNKPPH